MCYTYDELSRVTKRTLENVYGEITEEIFSYDEAGNIIGDGTDTRFVYDTNNRLVLYNGKAVEYDLDGNMLTDGEKVYTYDSANKLISVGNATYTYNVENIRVRNLCGEDETTYVYDNTSKLSRLLIKITNGVLTKYVYGRGLIGEETNGEFKTYHFDSRGSTVAISDENGAITDTFAYDTYGKLLARTGETNAIFLYNGRDGVITEPNGLIYMRARYYSPTLRRFINADIVAGEITNAITLNRYAYANANPVSFVDPLGLSANPAQFSTKIMTDGGSGKDNRGNNTNNATLNNSSTDRKNYINTNLENTNNMVYYYSQLLGFSLTEEAHKKATVVDALGGGIKTTISVNVSFQTPIDTPVNSEYSISSNTHNEEISASIAIPGVEDASFEFGIYTDKDRLAVGLYESVSWGEWSIRTQTQNGLKSQATAFTITYTPEDIYMPTVSITIDNEISHIASLAIAATVVVAVCAPEIVVAASPVVIDLINQFSTFSSQFATVVN